MFRFLLFAAMLTRVSGVAAAPGQGLPPQPGAAKPRPALALQVGHSNVITCLAFSPDGKTLASGSRDKSVRLWDVSTGEIKAVLGGHPGEVRQLAFSREGDALTVAAHDWNKTWAVRPWDVRSGRPTVSFEAAGGYRGGIISPDGKLFAAVRKGSAEIWDVSAGRVCARLRVSGRTIRNLAFSPQSGLAATVVSSSQTTGGKQQEITEVLVWHAREGRLIGRLDGDASPAGPIPFAPLRTEPVVFSPDASTLAVYGTGNRVRLWDVATRRLRIELNGSILFSPDGRMLAVRERDGHAGTSSGSRFGTPRRVASGAK